MRGKLKYCVSSPETASGGAWAFAAHAAAGLALGAAADTSPHGRVPKKSSRPPLQRYCIWPKQTATSAAWRARGKLEYCAPSPETASADACALAAHSTGGFALEAVAEMLHH